MNKWQLRYHWFKQDLTKWWYWLIHGIKLGNGLDHGSLLPILGKGEFVSVFRHGSIIDVISHKNCNTPKGTIRVIPCQYNHGFMVEYINDKGRLCTRTNLDYDMLYKIANCNSEKS